MDVSQINRKFGLNHSRMELIAMLTMFGALFLFIELAQPLNILEPCVFVGWFDVGHLQLPSATLQTAWVDVEAEAL